MERSFGGKMETQQVSGGEYVLNAIAATRQQSKRWQQWSAVVGSDEEEPDDFHFVHGFTPTDRGSFRLDRVKDRKSVV